MPIYEGSPKHHWPKGWGNLCPRGILPRDAQDLLDGAVRFPDVQHQDRYYSYRDGYLFEAQATDVERDIWHGYPILGSENTDVVEALKRAGRIDERTARRLSRQDSKPDFRGHRLDRSGG